MAMKNKRVLFFIIFLDILGTWMGMGVPIFNILFGFILGFYLFNKFHRQDSNMFLKTIFKYGILASFITMLFMIIIWSPFVPHLFDLNHDFSTTGIPLILYSPRASLVGWLVLMILISPFLQLMSVIFAAYLKMLKKINDDYEKR